MDLHLNRSLRPRGCFVRRRRAARLLAALLTASVLPGVLGAHAADARPLSVDDVPAVRGVAAPPPGSVAAASPEAPGSAAPTPSTAWVWPLDGARRVVRGFDPPAVVWGSGHRGVDLAGPAGTVVRAAGAGVVAFAGVVAGRPVVSVQHGSLRTTYEPVLPTVVAGQRVLAGQPLGSLQVPGHCAPAACLHLGLREGDRYLDPLGLYRAVRVRLLPLGHT